MRLGRMRRLGIAVAAALCVWVALVLAAPAAWADGYSMPRVSISAVVQEDGTLTVREERTFSTARSRCARSGPSRLTTA